jgi:hypothetical protein
VGCAWNSEFAKIPQRLISNCIFMLTKPASALAYRPSWPLDLDRVGLVALEDPFFQTRKKLRVGVSTDYITAVIESSGKVFAWQRPLITVALLGSDHLTSGETLRTLRGLGVNTQGPKAPTTRINHAYCLTRSNDILRPTYTHDSSLTRAHYPASHLRPSYTRECSPPSPGSLCRIRPQFRSNS